MATLHQADSLIIVPNESQSNSIFQTTESSIPAINYNDFDELNSMNGRGITGISIILQKTTFTTSSAVTEEYLYGNKKAIILPSEVNESVSGCLSFLDQIIDIRSILN